MSITSTPDRPTCGHETENGPCQQPVPVEGLKCQKHRFYTCGARRSKDGNPCQQPVARPDMTCNWHPKGHVPTLD